MGVFGWGSWVALAVCLGWFLGGTGGLFEVGLAPADLTWGPLFLALFGPKGQD